MGPQQESIHCREKKRPTATKSTWSSPKFKNQQKRNISLGNLGGFLKRNYHLEMSSCPDQCPAPQKTQMHAEGIEGGSSQNSVRAGHEGRHLKYSSAAVSIDFYSGR